MTLIGNRTRALTATFTAFHFDLGAERRLADDRRRQWRWPGVTPLRHHSPVFCALFMHFIGVCQANASVWSQRLRQLALGLALLGIVPSTLSTVEWLVTMAVSLCTQTRGYWGDNYYTTDCTAETGASFGESPTPIYIEHDSWYLVSGLSPDVRRGAECTREQARRSRQLA